MTKPPEANMSYQHEVLAEVAARHGTPTFVFFMDDVKQRVETLRAAFQGLFGISYAMKCNPHPAVLTRMLQWVDHLDVSSRGELARGLEVGFAPERITFTGPAKQRLCLEQAADARIGEVVVESLREARTLSEVALQRGTVQPVLVRIAPHKVPKGFGVNMAGRPCQFGVDEEDVDGVLREMRELRGIDIVGFHIYSGTQSLKAAAVAENYGIFIDIFRRVAETHDLSPRKLVFGSGLGIRYHEGDAAIDLSEVAAATIPLLRELKADPRFVHAELLLETGRYLIGEAGVYLTRVVNRKRSRGSEIATFDGGMHHHLGACGHLGMVIHRPYRMFKVKTSSTDRPEQAYDLYGPLCTTIDVLGRGVKLPGLEVDDVLAIESSGAYGASASPAGFISHPPANEVLVERDAQGKLQIVDPVRSSEERP